MPLQIGIAAPKSLARSAAFLAPASVLTAIALWIVIVELPDMGDLSGWIFAVIGGPPLTLLAFALRHFKRARAQRPSDLDLDGGGFTVRGGPHDGLRVKWDEVRSCTLEAPRAGDKEDESEGLHRIKLELRAGKVVWLAGTDHPVERASLQEVVQLIATHPLEVKTQDAPPQVLACRQCQAPVPPAAEPSVNCAFCSAANEVPAALREKVAAQQKVLARDATAVQRLLDQPGADFVGALFAFGGVFMLAAWPVAGGVAWLNFEHELATFRGGLALLVFIAASIMGFFTFLRGRLVDRQALELLTVRFCAREQPKGLACRRCFAPLPKGPARALVACAYCEAPNILSADFGAQARAVEKEESSLEKALKRRDRERRRWRFATAGGLMLIAASGYALWAGIGRDELAGTCEQGDLRACVTSGRKFFRSDPRHAEAMFKKACDGNDAEGCTGLADLYTDPLSVVDGPVLPPRKKACELGSAEACRKLGRLLREGDYLHRVNVDPSGATQAYERACTLGDGEGCTSYGFALSRGLGASIDRGGAAKAYARACELNDPMGCNNLGTTLETEDRARAAELYGRACDAGIALGCQNAKKLGAAH